MHLTGRIIEEQKNYLVVDTAGGAIQATTRGQMKKDKKRVCVGDMVDMEVIDQDKKVGIIQKIHDRTSYLTRIIHKYRTNT